MKKLLLLITFLFSTLLAEPSVLTEPAAPANQELPAPETTGNSATVEPDSSIDSLFSTVSSGLTLQFSNLPSHPYIGEIIAVTVKLTPLDVASGNIEYSLQNEEGIRIFSETPRRSIKSDAVYDTFYYLVQSSTVRLPDITAILTSTGASSERLTGTTLNASALTPPSTFANVLADKFSIINYKTTPYDQENNVVIFTVKASRCNIGSFSIPNAIKQGFESKLPNVGESQMTYYAIIPNSAPTLTFSIFNLKKQRFESLSIPIVVDDDTVSTQSDLSPTDERHTGLKMGVSGAVAAFFIALFYWSRQKWYLYFSMMPMFYLIFALLPNQEICVKKDAPVYLLPMNHGTIFEMTLKEEHLEAEKEVGDFTKVHLDENRVGWIHKRDLCTN
ncbi:MAG: hypothetical protein M0P91_14560 [Sulfuricurvum sp.]|uniref:hypothetical protein n=1 Tax=Sulfuricurvum sp. TaxID=2025608 RepID=UPI0025E4A7DE|nr:hypothetical protein [Sulfuricurvum sp.]MCK9374400.1 hypothetical protein [Sulfuricurvum sp.]